MKNKDKNLNQMYQGDIPDIIEIPLKKLHKNLDFINSIDLEETTVILTHKGKWVYSLVYSHNLVFLINKEELSEEENIDPRLSMLPAEYQTVPISKVISTMLITANEFIEMGHSIIDDTNYLIECGGEKI